MSKHQPGTDDENFRRAIGWQAPSAPLPDDYEEQLLERLFADGGPHLGDVSLHGLDELAPVSAGGPVSLRPERFAVAREAVEPPPPLVDTPPVSPKLSWRPSRRMGVVLAAAAAVTLVGVQQLPEPAPQQAVSPVALPAFAAPAPETVQPLVPETVPERTPRLSVQDDVEEDDTEGTEDASSDPLDPDRDPDIDAIVPLPESMRDPGAHLARRDATPQARGQAARADASGLDLPVGVATGVTLARFDGLPGSALGGEGMLMRDGLAGLGPATVHDFDPDADHAHVAAAILDDDMALPAGGEDAPGPALLPAVAPPVARPAVANIAPHSLGPSWLGLGVSMPRDVQTSVPAAIRVVGAIDISKTHRRLQF